MVMYGSCMSTQVLFLRARLHCLFVFHPCTNDLAITFTPQEDRDYGELAVALISLIRRCVWLCILLLFILREERFRLLKLQWSASVSDVFTPWPNTQKVREAVSRCASGVDRGEPDRFGWHLMHRRVVVLSRWVCQLLTRVEQIWKMPLGLGAAGLQVRIGLCLLKCEDSLRVLYFTFISFFHDKS